MFLFFTFPKSFPSSYWLELLSLGLPSNYTINSQIFVCSRYLASELYTQSWIQKDVTKCAWNTQSSFFHSVACSLAHGIFEGELQEDPYRLAVVFLQAIDRLFDTLNSSSLSYQNGWPWKAALRFDDENLASLQSFTYFLCFSSH